jgi:WbqC-like protein family
MKVGIMQPYFFPYIGYFQLISAVDKFIIYDDVNYINRGWINRNRILFNGNDFLFTLPLQSASQNKLIKETQVADDQKWFDKFIRTINQAYKKAPFYPKTFLLIEECLQYSKNNISDYNLRILNNICRYLNINTAIINSSSIYKNNNLHGATRILDICVKENATQYINPIGGLELYNTNDFYEKNIDLGFLKTDDITYPQFENMFIPYLSIIDVLMFNSTEDTSRFINKYRIIKNYE